ncbi:acyltransferase [Dyadobacter luteus]|uniref:Acyltransferase n=1 Tax=Dyadobacter luteus TaxID=2259619 RepID=A0A3D8YI72_9BACT|nr:acyltransferase [Dyadobacter luteus]REA64482.1 acyltransferase [Dyadobacter luteus]
MDIAKKFKNFYNLIFYELRYRYLLEGSIVRIQRGAKLEIPANIRIVKSKITLVTGSKMRVGNFCKFHRVNINSAGSINIEDNCILESGDSPKKVPITVPKGANLSIGKNCRIRSKVWQRFGSNINIGAYTNINEGSELRADEMINIGSYCMISYNCMIWDTNTHNIYSDERRRELTEQFFPSFGYEYEKPVTSPVHIGNDCWIGREVCILKGSKIGNSVIVGFRTLITGNNIESNQTVMSQLSLKYISRET